jgi:hypothetical protein
MAGVDGAGEKLKSQRSSGAGCGCCVLRVANAQPQSPDMAVQSPLSSQSGHLLCSISLHFYTMPTELDRALKSKVPISKYRYPLINSKTNDSRTSSWVPIPPASKYDLNDLNVLGFAGLVTAAAAWTIWGGDMFPAEPDPTGGSRDICIQCNANSARSCKLDYRRDEEVASCGMSPIFFIRSAK